MVGLAGVVAILAAVLATWIYHNRATPAERHAAAVALLAEETRRLKEVTEEPLFTADERAQIERASFDYKSFTSIYRTVLQQHVANAGKPYVSEADQANRLSVEDLLKSAAKDLHTIIAEVDELEAMATARAKARMAAQQLRVKEAQLAVDAAKEDL